MISDTSDPEAPTEGLATLDSTVNSSNQRVSTFDAFLPRHVALEREGHLTICTRSIVSQIVFSDAQPKPRAERVIFRHSDPTKTKSYSVRANREIVICSGAAGSPQVLMLRYVPLIRLGLDNKPDFVP